MPVVVRVYLLEPLSEFGALLPSRQYLVLRRAVELLLTVLALPVLLALLAVIAVILANIVAVFLVRSIAKNIAD